MTNLIKLFFIISHDFEVKTVNKPPFGSTRKDWYSFEDGLRKYFGEENEKLLMRVIKDGFGGGTPLESLEVENLDGTQCVFRSRMIKFGTMAEAQMITMDLK